MRSFYLPLILLMAAASAAPVVSFPGKITRAKSPNSDVAVTYFDPGKNADGIHEYSLRLVNPNGRFRVIDVFLRSVDISWAPTGNRFFVTDHVGSNVSECDVFEPRREGLRKTSLIDVLMGRTARMKQLLGAVDHTYVECKSWLAPSKVRVVAEGHGAMSVTSKIWTEFYYVFEYDVSSGDLRQISGSAKKTKFR